MAVRAATLFLLDIRCTWKTASYSLGHCHMAKAAHRSHIPVYCRSSFSRTPQLRQLYNIDAGWLQARAMLQKEEKKKEYQSIPCTSCVLTIHRCVLAIHQGVVALATPCHTPPRHLLHQLKKERCLSPRCQHSRSLFNSIFF